MKYLKTYIDVCMSLTSVFASLYLVFCAWRGEPLSLYGIWTCLLVSVAGPIKLCLSSNDIYNKGEQGYGKS
jgi:hypothetical protein